MDTSNRVMREIMRRVKEARKKAGLTQTDVAKALNCSQQTYNGYETLKRMIGVNDLLRLPARRSRRGRNLHHDRWTMGLGPNPIQFFAAVVSLPLHFLPFDRTLVLL